MMTNLRFWRCCVDFPTKGPEFDALTQMIEDNTKVTRETFLRHVDRNSLREIELGLGYSSYPSQGLTMAGDWHVSYHRSRFNGETVYYFRHSAIEYIFVRRIR